MGAIKVTFDVDGQHYDVVAASAVALQLECAVGFADETVKRLSEGSFEFALRDPKTGNKIELIGELARCERADDGGRVVRIWIGKNERNRSRRVRKDAGSGTGEGNESGPVQEDAGSGTGERNESGPNQQDAGSGIPDAGSGAGERNESGPIPEVSGSGIGERNELRPDQQDAGLGIPDAGSGIEDASPGKQDAGPGTGERNESRPDRQDAGLGMPDAGSGMEEASSRVEDAGSGIEERNEARPIQQGAGSGIEDAGSGTGERNESRPDQQDAGPGIQDAISGMGERDEDANFLDVSRMIADEIIAVAGGKGGVGRMDAGSGVGEGDEDANFLDVGRMLAAEMIAVGGDKGGFGKMDAGSGIQGAGSRIGERDEDTNSLDVGRMRAAKTIAVAGGKGGVGKTIFAVNLALALSRLQKNVTLLDGDINNCNCNTLLGITKVASSLEEYLRKERSFDEITVSTAYPGLRLVCGAQNKVDAFLATEMPRLLNDIRQVDADCLVIDLGAGVNDETLDLYRLADDKILMVTPQVTSLQNAYGFIKSAFFHDLKRSGGLAAFLDRAGSDPQKLHALIAGLEDGHTARHAFAAVLARQRFQIVGNMMNDDKDLKIIQNLQKVVGQYLRIDNTVLGTLASNEDIRKSVNRVTPFLVLSPDLPQSREMKRMAERLIQRTAGMPT